MYEYSTSLPSGTYLGKVWKCLRGNNWTMGEYVPDAKAKIGKDGNPETVGIIWRDIVVEDENGDISNTKPANP